MREALFTPLGLLGWSNWVVEAVVVVVVGRFYFVARAFVFFKFFCVLILTSPPSERGEDKF